MVGDHVRDMRKYFLNDALLVFRSVRSEVFFVKIKGDTEKKHTVGRNNFFLPRKRAQEKAEFFHF